MEFNKLTNSCLHLSRGKEYCNMSTFTGSQLYVVIIILRCDASLLLKFKFQSYHVYTSFIKNYNLFTSVHSDKYRGSIGFRHMENLFQSCHVIISFIRNFVLFISDHPITYSQITGFINIICVFLSYYLFTSFIRNYVIFNSDYFMLKYWLKSKLSRKNWL